MNNHPQFKISLMQLIFARESKKILVEWHRLRCRRQYLNIFQHFQRYKKGTQPPNSILDQVQQSKYQKRLENCTAFPKISEQIRMHQRKIITKEIIIRRKYDNFLEIINLDQQKSLPQVLSHKMVPVHSSSYGLNKETLLQRGKLARKPWPIMAFTNCKRKIKQMRLHRGIIIRQGGLDLFRGFIILIGKNMLISGRRPQVSALRPFGPLPLALEEISLSSKPLDYHFGSGKLNLQSSRCLTN